MHPMSLLARHCILKQITNAMNFKKIIPIFKSLRTMKLVEFVYPSIFILFFSIILVVFFFTMQFISQNINRTLSSEERASFQALDIEKYKLVAKKLNISVNLLDNDSQGAPTPSITEVITATTTPAVTATSTPAEDIKELDKKSITIFVKNSTNKNGVASALAKSLELSGFTKPHTGNEPTTYATTTIMLAENKSDYKIILLEEVRKTYPNVIIETAPKNDEFDVIVIIGTN